MGLTDPGTRSPGHLGLIYTHATTSAVHTSFIRLVVGVDLNDWTSLAADAATWATALHTAIGGDTVLTDWALKDNAGRLLHREPLAAPLAGTISGTNPWRSFTVTLVGTGNAISVAHAKGGILNRVFTGDAYDPVPGAKAITIAGHAGLVAVKAMFDASTRIFADFYGQKGDVHATAPVQLNAYAQRHRGF